MRDALDIIAQAVRKVIHGIDAPFVSRVMMFGVPNAIKQRIAQPDVGRSHIDLCPERARAVREFAILHATEQVEVLRNRTIAPRAVPAGTVRSAAVFVRVFGREIADVSEAVFDQPHRVGV